MKEFPLFKAFTLIEPGPVVMVTTSINEKPGIMTISWHMVLDFSPHFALQTGPWNHSFDALIRTRQCVLAIPTIDMLDTVIGVGTCSGVDTDKFSKFNLTAVLGDVVKAPLIKECYANIECTVIDYFEKYGIFILKAEKAWINEKRPNKTIFHYRGDGTFVSDGKKYIRYAKMKPKMAPGL